MCKEKAPTLEELVVRVAELEEKLLKIMEELDVDYREVDRGAMQETV